MVRLSVALAMLVVVVARADDDEQFRSWQDSFRQMEGEDWPAGNDYRTASGAPGHRYWQQRVDYDMTVRLDERARSLTGQARIVYHNNSPDVLPYLWLLLDQNAFKRDSIAQLGTPISGTKLTDANVRKALRRPGGFSIASVTDAAGRSLQFTIVDTLMRVELPEPIAASGGEVSFGISWSLPLIETATIFDRSGYECFSEAAGGSCIFQVAQWFPRLAAYSDYEGWHNKTFLGTGEFALEFGNYQVEITVPADHIVAATGELSNPQHVLTSEQRTRLTEAQTSEQPVYIVTPKEAAAAERGTAKGEKTWIFKAANVRDFAWASSRKFIWDAIGMRQDYAEQPVVMAMSFFPSVASPLWDGVSTNAIMNTLRTFSDFTFPYPYPVAQSVNGPVGATAPNGVEYPMISFNGSRLKPGASAEQATHAQTLLMNVVAHEVGHNYFPMIVNTDERQWAWMDEGLTSFLEYQTMRRLGRAGWDGQGEPRDIVAFMQSSPQVPIMTQSDSLLDYGRIAYTKPAIAVTILRESILGHAAFDRAFREFANRWRFKRATPYDFFRSMEESSGTDLDWFWRGWFYSTAHVDLALENISRWRREEQNFYWFRFRNVGGVVMPIVLRLDYTDGSNEIVRIPAEIWRRNSREATWQHISQKTIARAEIDPQRETADVDPKNNAYTGAIDQKETETQPHAR